MLLGCQTVDSVAVDFKDCALNFDEIIINLYPNPNKGKFTLGLTGVKDDVSIAILDFIGKQVVEEKIVDITSYKLEREFDLSEYERGIYFIRINYHDKVYYQRVVVQ